MNPTNPAPTARGSKPPRTRAAASPAGPDIEDSTTPVPAKAGSSRDEVTRLTYRSREVAEMLGISERLLQVEHSAGRFPRPDRTIGRIPLWRRETIERWVEEGGRR